MRGGVRGPVAGSIFVFFASGSSLSTGSVPIPAGASSSDSFTEDLGGGQAHDTVSAAGAVGPGQATASLTS